VAEDAVAGAGVALIEILRGHVEDAAVVLLQRIAERRGAVRGRGVLGEGAGEDGDGSGDGILRRLRIDAELAADRFDAAGAELRVEHIKNGRHGGPPDLGLNEWAEGPGTRYRRSLGLGERYDTGITA